MSTTFNTRIQLKYDTYENWNTNNPTLLKGEMAVVEVPVETGVAQNEPTYLLKIGDGTSDFKTLKWVSGTAADVYAWAKAATKPTYQASEIQGLEDFIGEKVKDTDTQYQIVKNGDMGFKLQSKPKNGSSWTDVSTIALVAPTYSLLEGTTNGTVKFGVTGSEVEVKVHGLGSAAYTESSAYDPAGSAETAKEEAIKEAGTAADEKITALNISQYAKTTEVEQKITQAKTELIGTGSGSSTTIKGAYDEAKTYTDNQIAAKLASTYKAGGSVAFDSLPELSAVEEGKVYNIIDEFTTTADFVEGAGKDYPAGTNVVCIDTSEDGFKWDVLAGMVDLSAYDTAAVTQGKINTAKQEAQQYADSKINALDKEDSAVANQFVTAVSEVDGVINVTRAQPTIENVNGLSAALAQKANDSDLSTVAKSGKIDDLTQTATIIFNCGSSNTVM